MPRGLLRTSLLGESREMTPMPASPEMKPRPLVFVKRSLRTNDAMIAINTGPIPMTSESSLAAAYLTPYLALNEHNCEGGRRSQYNCYHLRLPNPLPIEKSQK